MRIYIAIVLTIIMLCGIFIGYQAWVIAHPDYEHTENVTQSDPEIRPYQQVLTTPLTSKIKITSAVRKAVGDGVKIRIESTPTPNQFIAVIGDKKFDVTDKPLEMKIEGIWVPLDERAYMEFKKTPEYTQLSNATSQKSADVVPSQNNSEPSEVTSFVEALYPFGLPGTPEALPSISERRALLEKIESHTITLKSENEKLALFIAVDAKCPFCRKFFQNNLHTQFIENGYTLHLMPISKSRNYQDENASRMGGLFCSPGIKHIERTFDLAPIKHVECPHGAQYLESMTNATLLAGGIGTPSMFTAGGYLIAWPDVEKQSYRLAYKPDDVKRFLEHMEEVAKQHLL